MKKLFTAVVLLIPFLLTAQTRTYYSPGKPNITTHEKGSILTMEDVLNETDATVASNQNQAPISMTIVAPVFQLAANEFKRFNSKQAKKYSSSRTLKFNVEKLNPSLKIIKFSEKAKDKNGKWQHVISGTLTPKAIELTGINVKVTKTSKIQPVVYELTDLKVNYSIAKVTKRKNEIDLTADLSMTFFDGKEVSKQDIGTIQLNSIEVGKGNIKLKNKKGNYLYKSGVVFNSYLTQMELKIQETNSKVPFSKKIADFLEEGVENLTAVLSEYMDNLTSEETNENVTNE